MTNIKKFYKKDYTEEMFSKLSEMAQEFCIIGGWSLEDGEDEEGYYIAVNGYETPNYNPNNPMDSAVKNEEIENLKTIIQSLTEQIAELQTSNSELTAALIDLMFEEKIEEDKEEIEAESL